MGSIVGFALHIAMIVAITPESGSYIALFYIQLILLIGKDSYFNFLIKRVLSSFDRFNLGFLALRLFKMPKSIIRANTGGNMKCPKKHVKDDFVM